MEQIAVSGLSGFLGTHLRSRLKEVLRLNRTGNVPKRATVVFDLATYGNMAHHIQDPFQIYRANLTRVAKELRCIKGTNTKFIFMSTSSVELPTQTFYSASKKAAEEMIQIAVRDWGIKAVIARPFSITGAGEQYNHLIPKLLISCLNKTEMSFVAEPVHDFIDIDDVVEALITISKKALFEGEVYDIGTGVQTSNAEVLKLIKMVTALEPNLKYVDSMRKYDTDKWRSNPSMLFRLGWKPKKTLKQSIEEEFKLVKYGMVI